MSSFADYQNFDAVGLAGLIRSGEITGPEVVAAAIDRIEAVNPTLNAVSVKTYDRAMARLESGHIDGPFAGVPFLLKDLGAEWEGAGLTSGSRSMQNHVAPFTATLVRRFEDAGLVVLGRTTSPEFGILPYTESELHGITRNPWHLGRTAGGSSGGSGAAVAAGMVPAAHASDGGGSIRIPASQCGLFGLKPTRARTPVGPLEGENWFGFSQHHALTRSVRDSAAILDAISGPEPGDPYWVTPPVRTYSEEVELDPGRMRVGVIPGTIFDSTQDPECRRAVNSAAHLLETLGHQVEQIELPLEVEEYTWAFTVLVAGAVAETIRVSAELTGREEPDPDAYEATTWMLGIVGRTLTAADFARAMDSVRRAGRALGKVMESVDVLVSSTLSQPPFPHGALRPNAVERRLLAALKRAPVKPAVLAAFKQLAGKTLEPIPNTPLFNMTGQPAMSVPLHWTEDGLPVGVQFAGRFGDEATLFRLAGQLEKARPWFSRVPTVAL